MWTLLIALILAAPPQASTTATESDRRADTYAVYSALMYANPANRDATNPGYVIDATTFVPAFVQIRDLSVAHCVTPPPSLAASWAEALAEVNSGSIAPGTLDATLKLSRPYMLIRAGEAPRWAQDPQFKGSTDLFRLSVVYFNKNRTLALLYFTATCGSLCGTGSWAVFEKLNHPDGQSSWIKQPGWVRCVAIA